MSHSNQPLALLLEQAEKRRDEAVRRLETARRHHDGALAQLQSLGEFRRQYQERWSAQFNRQGGVEILRCYQEFMTRLDEAERDQRRRCEQLLTVVEEQQARTLESEQRLSAMTRLQARRDDIDRQRELKSEQKSTDEMAGRLLASASLSPMSTVGLSLVVRSSL